MYFRSLFLSLFSATMFISDKPEIVRTFHEQRSFCYWETHYSKPDPDLWNDLEANHLYIRYFDVDWDPISNEAKPIASVTNYDSIPSSFTPSIFLTNKVFENSSKKELELLSSRITKRIDELTSNFGEAAFYRRSYEYSGNETHWDSLRNAVINEWKKRYPDILIDCDWTAGTRDKFFYFIQCLKKDITDKNITVTLRLWQYKQNKPEDIPPVDRCLLMCYNMQAANDYRVQNSIAALPELKKYVSGTTYPLKLDVALPLFSWAVLFRNEQFIGLLGNHNRKMYSGNSIDYDDLGDGRFRALTDKVAGNYFIRKGDIIRVEEVSGAEVQQMADYLKSEIPMDSYSRVTFFSWNTSYINHYGTNEIKKIYSLLAK